MTIDYIPNIHKYNGIYNGSERNLCENDWKKKLNTLNCS